MARKSSITDEQEQITELMIYGPYLPEWYREDGTIANTNREIAARLGLPKAAVDRVADKIYKRKISNIGLII